MPETLSQAELVSVVVTCYNQAHFLAAAIESVLEQTYSHFEIIVVDDGSTDNTSQVAGRYPGLRCIYQRNQGLAAARNTGLKDSGGKYVVFLDADDRLLSIALETGVQCLNSHPECAFVSGHYTVIGIDGSLKWHSQRTCIAQDHYTELLRGNYIGMHATVMYRRFIFDGVGEFDTTLKACEDYDMFLRIARTAPVHCHDKTTAEYRHHDANMSKNLALMLKSSLTVLRSQRQYLVRQSQWEAFRSGVHLWQKFFGDRMVPEVRTNLARNEWSQAIRRMLVLLRYYPRGFVNLVLGVAPRIFVVVPRSIFGSLRSFIGKDPTK